jgi:2,4-dienoyl-CoA reductase-like NADH-dependent reductase (Old Yellow Enzyme family)
MSQLFSPLTIRGLTLRNRTVVSPMCQYSARHGLANDWHLVHLGRFAQGGFGLVIVEATAVTPEGRISYGDLGLWNDEQIAPLRRIVDFLHAHGSAAGIQLAHAGRKAATPIAWRHGFDETEEEKIVNAYESWTPVAPSAAAHAAAPYQVPVALDLDGIEAVKQAFVAATHRSEAAGFDMIDIHSAHGYLLHQFLSPVANSRTDRYGGSLENRMRLTLEIAELVRAAWPADKPIFTRLSVTDWRDDGWSVADSTVLSHELKALGIDVIDSSSGGFEGVNIRPAPLYQVPLAATLRRDADIPTMAVGLITEPADAEAVLQRGEADLIALARGALDDPNWPIHARHALDATAGAYDLWPLQARERIRSMDRALGRRTAAE